MAGVFSSFQVRASTDEMLYEAVPHAALLQRSEYDVLQNYSHFFFFTFFLRVLSFFILSQYRADKGGLPEAGDMEQAEAVFELAKGCNEDGGFKAEGLDDSKVRSGRPTHVLCGKIWSNVW